MSKMPVRDLRLHREASLVPDMRPDEWAAFVADVRERGIVEPLVVCDTTVLDGRHRLRAAKETGLESVPVRMVQLDAAEARSFVIKAAVLRRHLTDGQRGMLSMMYAKAHPKPRSGGPRPKSEQEATATPRGGGSSGHRSKARENPARTEAAALFNATPKATEKSAFVLAADPDLAEKVRTGEVTLAKAVQQAKRDRRLAEIDAKPLPVPTGRFDVLLADPPWRYDFSSTANREIDNPGTLHRRHDGPACRGGRHGAGHARHLERRGE